jgi:hypothetical protein
VWTTLASRFASQSKARTSYLKRQLQSGSQTCSEYLLQAKSWTDQLNAVGKTVDEDDLISYIMSGLNSSYTGFITTYNIVNRDATASFDDFQDDLLNHEMLIGHHQQQHQCTTLLLPTLGTLPCTLTSQSLMAHMDPLLTPTEANTQANPTTMPNTAINPEVISFPETIHLALTITLMALEHHARFVGKSDTKPWIAITG